MPDFNRVILLGYIGNEPELKTSVQGKPYLRLSIATHSFKPGGHKTTHWHRVVVFGTQAQVCSNYLRKGSPVLVEGSMEVRTYTGDDGKKQTMVSVVAQRVQFLGGRSYSAVEQNLDHDVSEHIDDTDFDAAEEEDKISETALTTSPSNFQ